jgi:hypothetical protein
MMTAYSWRIGFHASIGEWYFDENVATFFWSGLSWMDGPME